MALTTNSLLQSSKTRFLYKQGPVFDLLVIGIVVITNVIIWNFKEFNHSFLLFWTMILLTITGIKYIALYGHSYFPDHAFKTLLSKPDIWVSFFLFFTALTSILLGIGGIIFKIPNTPSGFILFPIALAGLTLCSAVIFSTSFPAFFIVAFFSMVPFGLHSLLSDSIQGITLGLADIVFLTFTVFAAQQFNFFAQSFIHLQDHIISIIKSLEQSRKEILPQRAQSFSPEISTLAGPLSTMKSFKLLEKMVEAGTTDLINAYQSDHKNKERLELAINASNLGLWDWDLVTDKVYYQNFEGILGYKKNEEPGLMAHLQSLVHPEDFNIINGAILKHFKDRTSFYSVQYRVKHKSGSWIWVEDRGKAVEWNNNRVTRLIGTHHDITLNKDTNEQLELAATVFDNISEAIFVLDKDLKYILVNDHFSKITGYTLRDVQQQTPLEYRHVPEAAKDKYLNIYNKLIECGHWQGELLERRKNGDPYPQWLQINAIFDENNIARQYVGIFSDLTNRKESEEQLSYLANYDSITGLANRSLFKNRLHTAINHARQKNTKVALLYIDLDRFKPINDTYGHEFGDQILAITAERLIKVMSSADTISRLGSDEFTVIIDNYISRSEISELCLSFIEAMKAPFKINNIEIALGCSIGISEYPRTAKELQTMLNLADSAMYQSKRLGGNLFHFFTGDWQAYSLEKLKLETNLRQANLKEEITVYYQPKLNLYTNTIDSVEALVRWNHPVEGILSPLDFIPVAEEIGLVSEIGEVVLDKACQQLVEWNKKNLGKTKISINLSAQQILKGDLPEVLNRTLIKYQLNPSMLEVELTESMLMEDIEETVSTLNKIKDMGITILLDDFGTGYSSLSYLKKFPIDVLKIDQSFVRDIDTNSDDAAIVKAIIVMGHTLDLSVIAEGVERQEHLAFLRGEDCDGAQGHLVSEPVNGTIMTELLLKEKTAANTA